MPRVIPDTSCLILLKKIGALELLIDLYSEVLVTEVVLKEYQDPLPISHSIIPLQNPEFFTLLCHQIDPGEASVIALASQEKDCLMILDDLKGRKVASILKLDFTGTLGLLVKAKRSGFIPEIKPFVNKLIDSGIRISPLVLEEIEKDYP